MKTFAEQVADLQATRAAKHEEMKGVARKSVDESRSMDDGEAEQFETLQAEIKRLDEDISRLSVLARMDAETAKPVEPQAKAAVPTVPVQVKSVEKLEPGIGFARMARVKALARMENMPQIQVAKSIYPKDSTLHDAIVKGDVPAANTGNTGWASNLILDSGSAFADFLEYLRPRTVVGQVEGRLRRIPFDTPVLLQTTPGSADWVKEGHAKPVTSWAYDVKRLIPLKVAAIAAATKEQLMRASAASDALIRDELARAVGSALDSTFVGKAAASSGTSPAGIRYNINEVPAVGAGSGGVSVDSIRCDIAAFMKALVSTRQSLAGAFWIMPETVAIDLAMAQTLAGGPAFPGVTPTGGTLGGLPVITSQYVPTETSGPVVMLVKGDGIVLADEGGVQVSMSDQASIEMNDAPAAISGDNTTVTAPTGKVVSLWQTNSVAFLVERFMNWQVVNSNAVVWAGVDWSAC